VVYDLGSLSVIDYNSSTTAPVITGSITGSHQGEVDWSSVGAAYYRIHEWIWDASTGMYDENDATFNNGPSPTYTSIPPWSLYLEGDYLSDYCNYDWVAVSVDAYYHGVFYGPSNLIYFQGPKIGSGGAC
jgi:hypothetical protein